MVAPVFSKALFDRICAAMAEGKSLREICKAKDMPNRRTVMRWIEGNEKLAAQYSEAQALRAEHYFDEIIKIADNGKDPAKTRVQIDARKWVLSRMNPKKYGDKLDIDAKVEGKIETITRRVVDPAK